MSELLDRILEGENQHQDFKFKIDDSCKIARTLCAFANTDGGSLLIGVKDSRKIVGCDPKEELQMIEIAAKSFCQPEIEFTSKVWQEEFRLVLEIIVPKSKQIPHKSKDDNGRWHPYIRVQDHTTVVNKIVESVWKEQRKASFSQNKLNQEDDDLLNIIRGEQKITLSQLYKKSNSPLSKVDEIVVRLICQNFVEMKFERDGVYYKSIDLPH